MIDGRQFLHYAHYAFPLYRQFDRLCKYFRCHSAGEKYIYIRDNLPEVTRWLPLLRDMVDFIKLILTLQAGFYFVAAGWTALACLYTFIRISCGWKSSLALHFDFFIHLISGCFQCAIGVLSAINSIILEQHFPNLIAQSIQLNTLQQLVLSVAILYFVAIFPLMIFLLWAKWEVFNGRTIQEDRAQLKVKMISA